MSDSLDAYLILSGLLFAIGSFGFLARRNAISMLMSIELMLNGVNLAIVAFGAFGVAVDAVTGAKTSLAAQGSIVALLENLRKTRGISMLFVTHNLALVRSIAARVQVLNAGELVESGFVVEVLDTPKRDYTKRLLSNSPAVD